ncbi:MAG TPA: DegV family protein [Anaerolineae bacterium]|nr:DegV family protein [Anaerolineae bacterium]
MIKIVTDTTAYISEPYLRAHDIRVVPLNIHFGVEAFKETVEITNDEFYARLKAAPTLPTTSQPSPGDFLDVFRPLADAGHEILVLPISSRLSGTYTSATAAREMLPDAAIQVVDTLNTGLALELLIRAAVEAVGTGATLAAVTGLMEAMKAKVFTLFVVDTLEYLAKGGRIGSAKALMGTMLSVKPILTLKDGSIQAFEQVRTKRKAVARMVDLIVAHAGSKGSQARVTMTHSLALDEAEAARREVVARLGCAEPPLSELGPVIGAHTGPGVVSAAIYV